MRRPLTILDQGEDSARAVVRRSYRIAGHHIDVVDTSDGTFGEHFDALLLASGARRCTEQEPSAEITVVLGDPASARSAGARADERLRLAFRGQLKEARPRTEAFFLRMPVALSSVGRPTRPDPRTKARGFRRLAGRDQGAQSGRRPSTSSTLQRICFSALGVMYTLQSAPTMTASAG